MVMCKANSLNSGEPLTDNAEGNPERSHFLMERATTSRKTYTQAGGSGEYPILDNEIVCSMWKHMAALKSGVSLANLFEHLSMAWGQSVKNCAFKIHLTAGTSERTISSQG